MTDEMKPHADRIKSLLPQLEIVDTNSYWCITTKDSDGRKIHIVPDDKAKKYKISGVWPLTKNNVYCSPNEDFSIGISWTKSPEKFLKDFQNRFYLNYIQEYKKQEEICKSHEERDNIRKTTIENICELTGGKESGAAGLIWCHKNFIRTVRVNYNAEFADIELTSIPIEKAKRLINFLKELNSEN